MNHPTFTRPLDADEDARAQALYNDLIAGLTPSEPAAAQPAYERARILSEQGGINWCDPAHLRALGVVSGEDEAYLVNPRNEACPRIAVSLPAMTGFVASNDLMDIDAFEGITAEWDGGILELVAPAFVEEWTLISTNGTWISSVWNAGDLSMLAGSAGFIDAYADVRPDASSEVIEWLLVQGETAATDDPQLAAISRLRKNITHHDYVFQISDLQQYLLRFYSEDDLEYIWATAEKIFRSDTRRGLTADERNFPTHSGPPAPRVAGAEVAEFLDSTMMTSGSADERLTRLLSRDRGIRSRLDAIWGATN